MDNKFIRWRVKEHSPAERCESSNAHGPCPYCKVPGSEYCPRHGANKGIQAEAKEVTRNYRLRQWKRRVGELADSDGIKSLREEVGILRMLLEETLNQCETPMDLLLYSQKMADLVMKIERLVVSCDKLENRMGLLLNKDSVLQLANTYVQIINNHIADPEVIERVSLEIAAATEKIDYPVLSESE
jgi:hypothetical protein